MRTVFKLIVVVAMMATTHLAWASYTFTMKLDISGSCSGIDGGGVHKAVAQGIFDHYVNQVNLGIPSRAECEQARQIIMSEINMSYDGCRIRVICGPCTGSGGAGDAPGVNLEGPSKGGSFYSGNASSEVRDWDKQNDALKQMLTGTSTAIPQDTWTASVYNSADNWIASGKGSNEKEFASNASRNSKTSGFVIDPDKPFVSLNDPSRANEGIIPIAHKPYLEKTELNAFLMLSASYEDVEFGIYEMYRQQVGCSKELLEKIEKKPESQRTENEEQLLDNYYKFKDECYDYMRKSALEDEGKREIDMTTIAFAMAYDPDQSNKQMQRWLSETTGYKRMDLSQVTVDNPMYNLANLINQKNLDNKDTGFNAQILMREKDASGEYEYTIVFNGNGHLTPSLLDSFGLGNADEMVKEFGSDSKHFQAALEIGRAIASLPDNCTVNITGSALAGSWASVAGLASGGAPTTTVNAMGVPQPLLEKYGLSEDFSKHNYNITAMISSDEMKDHLQKISLNPIPQTTALLGPASAIGDQKVYGTPGVAEELSNLQLNTRLKDACQNIVASTKAGMVSGFTDGLDTGTSIALSALKGTPEAIDKKSATPIIAGAIEGVIENKVDGVIEGMTPTISEVFPGAVPGAIKGAIASVPEAVAASAVGSPALGVAIVTYGAVGGAVEGVVETRLEGAAFGAISGGVKSAAQEAYSIGSDVASAVGKGLVINEAVEKAEVNDFAKKIGADEKKMKYEKNGKSDFKNDLKIVMYTSSGNQNSQIRWKNWRKLSKQIEDQNKKKK